MKFQPGDKVKFLNETGGGIITRIIDMATVEVAIEEGFEVPVLISELVKVGSDSASERLFDVDFNVDATIEKPSEKITGQEFTKTKAAAAQPSGVYLGFQPLNQKLLITGLVNIVLINHTEHDLLYNLFQRTSKGFRGADYGSIGPESSVIIASIEHGSLTPWTDCCIQLMFHHDELPALIHPGEQLIRLKHGKLDKEDNYLETPFLQGRAYILQIFSLPLAGAEAEQKVLEIKPQFDTSLIKKHMKDEDHAEVDLHIHSLVEGSVNLTATQKMDIQLDYFKRCLESAITAGIEKVVFIHGVGAGVLKIEIRKILDAYDFLEFYDASIAKYGIGATEVIIHRRK